MTRPRDMRPLELSPSALSNSEFDLYTTSLHSAVRDSGDDMREYSDGEGGFYYDDVAIGKGSIRNWLRDNYDHVPVAAMYKILRMFFPASQMDRNVSGHVFFAILRLVVHVENGERLRRSLVFVQATPLRPGRGVGNHTVRVTSQIGKPFTSLAKKHTPKSVVLAQNSPLRCQRCINAKVDCIINPTHIVDLMKWKDTPGWKSRPREKKVLQAPRDGNEGHERHSEANYGA
ncbi:hypothetical protein BJ912DRAFT_1002667 [Pholiota molesta]|nr:hypothetical protein BJ912DRAFT_1002667 [Pholiota molesta]